MGICEETGELCSQQYCLIFLEPLEMLVLTIHIIAFFMNFRSFLNETFHMALL